MAKKCCQTTSRNPKNGESCIFAGLESSASPSRRHYFILIRLHITRLSQSNVSNPVYGGQTPTHPDGLVFCGWSKYLDEKGNAVMTAMFQKEPVKTVVSDGSNVDVEKPSIVSTVKTFADSTYTKLKNLINTIFFNPVKNQAVN